jgi:phospholipid/cholesterol/gamma-HCH transport system substrate-binding protein
MQSAAKVGALLLVFIVLVIGGYAILGSSLLGPGKDVYYARFADAGGTPVGSRLLMAGVQIGTVSKVALVSPTEAKLTLSVNKGIEIPTGSEVVISGSLIGLGESSLTVAPPAILPGTDLQPGATLEGHKASPLDSILPGGGKDTIAELTKTMAAVRKLLEDGTLKQHVTALMENTNKTMENAAVLTKNLTALVSRMNVFVDANQSKIASAISSGTQAVADVRNVTYEFAKLAKSGKVQHDTTEIFASLNSAAKKANELVTSMNALVNDPKLRDPLNHTLQNTSEITDTGKVIANNAALMSKDGTVITKNAIGLTEKANEIATKASDIEDQLKVVLDKVGGFFGKRPDTSALSSLSYEMDLLRTTRPNYWRTDINFKLPLAEQTLNVGIYDAFEGNKLNLEVGKPITKSLGYRYGIYASKVAGGVDYIFTPRLSLKSDIWDINDPKLDVRFGYEFGNGLLGWLGVDRLFNGNSATIGIGVRK